MIRNRPVRHPIMACAVLLLISTFHCFANISPIEDPREPSCGAWALAVLGGLQGLKLDFSDLEKSLGPQSNRGHSMAQIVEAGRRRGLGLRAVRLDRAEYPTSSPAIVRVERAGAGHFVVIRPVGLSGRLVQVFDPLQDVQVIDYTILTAQEWWTNVAIVPESDPAGRSVFLWLPLVTAVLLVSVQRSLRSRGRPFL